MGTIESFIGVDVSAEKLAVSIFSQPGRPLLTKDDFENSFDGFKQMFGWLSSNGIASTNCILCLEATGVYGESLCYFFQAQGFQIAVEPPLKVKRAFQQNGRKTDAVDSQQIAEYAYRFHDELNLWKSNPDTIEQLRVLLALRDQFTVQSTQSQNILNAFQKKPVKTQLAENLLVENIAKLAANKKIIDKEIKRLLEAEPSFKNLVKVLISAPGIGILLTASLLIFSNGFSRDLNAKQLSAYLGICPYEHQSGSSVNKKPKSRGFGPARIRKLLHLAARSVATHNPYFREYFHRKVAQGKPKLLVLNNIQNKLLKVVCAMVKSKTVFIPDYRSVNPALLKKCA